MPLCCANGIKDILTGTISLRSSIIGRISCDFDESRTNLSLDPHSDPAFEVLPRTIVAFTFLLDKAADPSFVPDGSYAAASRDAVVPQYIGGVLERWTGLPGFASLDAAVGQRLFRIILVGANGQSSTRQTRSG